MALSYRACVAYRNFADLGTITATSSFAALPPAILQDPHVARKWRGRLGASEAIVLDLGAAMSLDTIALMGTNATQARVRISATDPTGQSGEAYDSGPRPIDPDYDTLVELAEQPVLGRYVRIDLTALGASNLEAGRLFAGLRSQFAFNFGYGWTAGYLDRSRKSKSRGGQTFVDRDSRLRVFEMTFEHVKKEQRYGFVEEMDRLNGESLDVLFVADPSSENLGRDSLWGLIDGMTPISQPYFDSYSKTYKIEERL